MSNEQNKIEVYYSPGDLCAMLNIKESTLRKYAVQLEKVGWKYAKNSNGHRQYTDTDIAAIRRIIQAKDKSDITLEKAAKQVVSMLKGEYTSVPATMDEGIEERYSNAIKELKETVQKQTEFIKVLADRLEERDKFIQQQLAKQEERSINRDKKFIEAIRGMQEQKKDNDKTRKLIAATQEKIEAQQKKGFLARLLGR
jgi:DNA-binding transcriptional MerR regulator